MWGWVGCLSWVLGYDLYALWTQLQYRKGARAKRPLNTASTAYRLAVKHPIRRWPTTVSWVLLTLHLFHSWKYDPLTLAGKWVTRQRA